MKKKLIILNTPQFGSLTDSYKWCQYLKDIYDITFICFDNNLKRMDINGICYKYVHRFDNDLIRGIWYILYSFFYCLFHSGKIFIVYFEHCDLFPRLMPWKHYHVDIRTLSVNRDTKYNEKKDKKLNKSISYFKSVSLVSLGVMHKLKLFNQDTYVLPLGSDIIDDSYKTWNELRLLYVGTLQHRDIPKTVEGFFNYVSMYGKENISYDIIGDGPELIVIKDYVKEKNLQDVVFIHGKLPYDELVPYFKKCNVGVSFVPIESCYQNQPPTKTFEYVLSGLYCIATATNANKDVITSENGILIQDTIDNFTHALQYIRTNHSCFDSKVIRDSLIKDYSWKSIVTNKLIPIIERF